MSQKKAKGRGTMSRRMARAEAERRRQRRRKALIRTAQIGIPILVFVVGLVVFFAVSGDDTGSAVDVTAPVTTVATTTTAPPPDVVTPTVTSCDQGVVTDTAGPKPQFATRPVMSIDPAKTYVATIETVSGTMTAALSPTIAPETVNSFVFLARCGFYDNLTFHRIVPDFVIQGGDPVGNGTGGPGYKLPDELPNAAPFYPLGALAMANSGPNTSGSQFFIITGPQGEALPPQYSLFGQIVSGYEVAEAIEAIPTEAGSERPSQPAVITRITIEER